MTQPIAALTEPTASDPMPSTIPLLAGGNIISPSYYVSGIVQGLFGFDIFGWCSQKVSGDWEAVHKAGVAAGNLSRFNTAFTSSMQTDVQNQAASWQGNAADAAKAYFTKLGQDLGAEVTSLEDIEHQLTNISTGMRELGRAVGDGLQWISDQAILLGASIAAEAVLASSLVGSPAAIAQAAVSAAYAALILDRGWKLVSLIGDTYKVIYRAIGALNIMSGQTDPDTLTPLPNAGYAFPGA